MPEKSRKVKPKIEKPASDAESAPESVKKPHHFLKHKNLKLEAAKAYLKLGWSVIPIIPGTKKSYIKWKPYQHQMPTVSELNRWWKEHPIASIAVVCGKLSGVVAIDADSPEALEFLRVTFDIDESIKSKSGRAKGGWHLFFRHPHWEYGVPRIKSNTGLADNVDFRGDDALAVLPPSIHKTGNIYEWVNGDPLEYGLDDLPDLTPDLLKFCDGLWAPEKIPTSNIIPLPGSTPGVSVENMPIKALLLGVGEGKRNVAATKVAGYFLAKNPYNALSFLRQWNQQNTPALSDKELVGVFNSIRSKEIEKILAEEVDPVKAEDKTGFIDVWDAIRNIKPTEWLIQDVLEKEALSIMHGPYGCYKSFLVMDQGLHIAYGRDWHGKQVKQGVVFMIIGEGRQGYMKRVMGWHGGNKVKPDKEILTKHFHVSKTPILFLNEESARTCGEQIEALRSQLPDLPMAVWIDTLNKNMGGNENSAEEVGKFFNNIGTYIGNKDFVQVVHHPGKKNQDQFRGSYALGAGVDAEYNVTVLTDQSGRKMIKYKNLKMKDSELIDDIYFVPEQVVVEIPNASPETTIVLRADSPVQGCKAKMLAHIEFLGECTKKSVVAMHEKFGYAGKDPQDSCRKALKKAIDAKNSPLIDKGADVAWGGSFNG